MVVHHPADFPSVRGALRTTVLGDRGHPTADRGALYALAPIARQCAEAAGVALAGHVFVAGRHGRGHRSRSSARACPWRPSPPPDGISIHPSSVIKWSDAEAVLAAAAKFVETI